MQVVLDTSLEIFAQWLGLKAELFRSSTSFPFQEREKKKQKKKGFYLFAFFLFILSSLHKNDGL